MKKKFQVLDREKWMTVDNSFKEIYREKVLLESSTQSKEYDYYVSMKGGVFIYRLEK